MSSPHTSKSFKSTKRDKINHSDKTFANKGAPKKGGAGGKGTWGKAGDELNYNDNLDREDPNYDPLDEEEFEAKKGAWHAPAEESEVKFASSIADLNRFKKAIKGATEEFFTANDPKEFSQTVNDFNLSIYHQDIPNIVVKMSLDRNAEDRGKISSLLHYLFKHDIVTQPQMTSGFRKLYHALDDLLIDAPNAKQIINEFVQHAIDNDFLDQKDVDEMQRAAELIANTELVAKTKASFKSLVQEYFRSEDLVDAGKTIDELKVPQLHFELVKQLISAALDRTNRERELASLFLARYSGDKIDTDQVVKGFTLLLGRVEDLFLDVPDVLRLLSCFLARAVTDEAVPPAFLLRADLTDRDMGSQVLEQAQVLLKTQNAGYRMSKVWRQASQEGSKVQSHASGAATSGADTVGTAPAAPAGSESSVSDTSA